MRRNRRARLLGAVAAVAALTLSACGGGSGAGDGAEGVEGGQITWAFDKPSDSEDFLSIQPNYKCTSACVSLFQTIFDPLLALDPANRQLVGVLAEKWETNADATAFTFHLRKDATFHDGSPVTAEDVAYSYDRTCDKQYLPGNAYACSLLGGNYAGADVVDDKTVVIRTTEPDPDFLMRATPRGAYTGIVPKHVVEQVGHDKFGENPVGSGPFKFVEWVRGDHVTVERNPDYKWGPSFTKTAGGPPHVDRMVFRYIGDAQTRLAALRSGEIDGMDGVPAADQVSLESDPQFTVTKVKYQGGTGWLYVNTASGITADVQVRRAISMAIDREAVNKTVYFGVATPTENVITEEIEFSRPDIKVPGYDPEKAKATLAAAGWTPGPDGIMQKDGQRLEFDGVVYNEQAKIFEILESQLRAVGIVMHVKPVSPTEGLKIRDKQEFGLWMSSVGFGSADIGVLYSTLHSSQRPPNGYNPSFFNNPQFDAAIVKGRSSVDQATRAAAFTEAQQILVDQLPHIPVVRADKNFVTRAGVTGVIGDFAGPYRLFYDAQLTEASG
ncbi:ABC transporter substrate-binding protein [Pseudonocardia sulfidoxydans NBRC 16205]|uniref:ABC transporter substrate-binding protein n=1 Tax=Pseudonocardia sulfidoxydans NBRC 16205 TaxID=1223511 RepID=A0A511DJD7_9PSEU|nr:ABC transporter substrate-binding protein [Pseudonocardia sulfidoxydans NBRC 16205]